ncbi:class II fructose-bisphosphatase [Myxococcota bacterium]|nr:class II fructose-bisphosphatase [Myxococcota bacterium]
MDRNLALEAVRVTEAAALASARLMGRGDRHAADQAAVTAMRRAFSDLQMRGRVVIGEGERDEAPMLYIGEQVGRWDASDPEIDLALDPLEGTNLCATGAANAISVIAMARGGKFLHAPDTYMNKIAVGPAGRGAIDLTKSAKWNLEAVADAKGVYVEDLTVVILDRPRHEALIREVREAGARIKLIGDGDVSAAIATCKEETGVDMLMGIGGAPEGVIAAAALRCVGGDMLGQLKPRNAEEVERAKRMGIEDIDKIYHIDELASGDVLFAATGVTTGDFLKGVRFMRGGAATQSVVMRSKTRTVRFIDAEHHFERKPNYDAL